MSEFSDFVHSELANQAKSHFNMFDEPELSVLKARAFIVLPEFSAGEYHVNLLSSTPPPLTVNKRTFNFNKNSLVLNTPGALINSSHFMPSQDYYMLTITQKYFDEILSEMKLPPLLNQPLTFPYSRTLLNHAHGLYHEMERHITGYRLVVQSKLTEFVVQLVRESRLLENKENHPGKNYQYARKAIEFMQVYHNAEISLNEICKELNLSRYHFIRIFKEHTGTTPHAYLLNIRLERAVKFLKNRTFTMDEVALSCGFVSRSHFTQCFKKRYGLTPSQYLQQVV